MLVWVLKIKIVNGIICLKNALKKILNVNLVDIKLIIYFNYFNNLNNNWYKI